MAHMTVPEAEAILEKEFKVLNHGFVRLVDYLGSDARIVEAARVSYGPGTKTAREDKGLIDYLIRHRHTSPLEQVVFTFHVKMPIFVARQWVRHRTARMNEISGRYSIMRDESYVPDPQHVHYQSESNRQGRDDLLRRGRVLQSGVRHARRPGDHNPHWLPPCILPQFAGRRELLEDTCNRAAKTTCSPCREMRPPPL